ncbi:MAG: type IV secretion system DNA-binding domain-containing protein [Clostridia bacterium]|nr:type IV secretion system DNA-binding domain-containing protein [Clostridia bacterium]
MEDLAAFENCLYAIPQRMKEILSALPSGTKAEVQEIRIRNNLPLCLTVKGKPLFVLADGQTSVFKDMAFICNSEDTQECLRLLVKHSVFAHTDEIKNGFIRMNGGNRAGICGTFSADGMISNISGINIRIARQIIGCAEGIYDKLIGGILVLGAPGSGKTTLIRDLVRLKSNRGKRVSVVDTRGEISAMNYGVSPFDLGANTDTYLIENKALGIEMALRTMFPDVIAFDEIGSISELVAVKMSFNGGAEIITSAHIGNEMQINDREIIKKLLDLRAVETVVFLPKNIGGEIKIKRIEEIKNDSIF